MFRGSAWLTTAPDRAACSYTALPLSSEDRSRDKKPPDPDLRFPGYGAGERPQSNAVGCSISSTSTRSPISHCLPSSTAATGGRGNIDLHSNRRHPWIEALYKRNLGIATWKG